MLDPSAIADMSQESSRKHMRCLRIGCRNDHVIEFVWNLRFSNLTQIRTSEVQHIKMRMKLVPEKTSMPLFIFTRDTDNPHLRIIELRLALRPMRHHPSHLMPQFQKSLCNIDITDRNGRIALQRVESDKQNVHSLQCFSQARQPNAETYGPPLPHQVENISVLEKGLPAQGLETSLILCRHLAQILWE